MRAVIALGLAVALSLGGCAAFKAAPTPADCAQTQSDLVTAQGSLALASLAVQVAKDNGADPKLIANLEKAVSISQQAVDLLTKQVAAKCPAALK